MRPPIIVGPSPMETHLPARALCALLPLAVLSGCATLLGSSRPALTVAADADGATIHDARGSVLGVTPLRQPLRLVARRDTLLVTHPVRGTGRVAVDRRDNGLIHIDIALAGAGLTGMAAGRHTLGGAAFVAGVLGWVIDRKSGAAWRHAPDSVYAVLPPPPGPPPLAQAPSPVPPDAPPPAADAPPEAPAAGADAGAFADTAVVVETLRRLATAAYAAGCDSTFPRFWLNEHGHLADGGAAPRALSPAEAEAVQRNVDAAAARLRAACDRASQAAREDRWAIENPRPPVAADLSAPVLFAYNSAAVADSVLSRLRELALRLRDSGDGLTLVVEGFADPAGGAAYNDSLGLARARAVIAVLHAAGLPAVCCQARSYGADPAWLAAPGHSAGSPLARYNRRVTFHLAPAETER